jgi:hypothetical protein
MARLNLAERPAPIALFLPTMDDGGAEHVRLDHSSWPPSAPALEARGPDGWACSND